MNFASLQLDLLDSTWWNNISRFYRKFWKFLKFHEMRWKVGYIHFYSKNIKNVKDMDIDSLQLENQHGEITYHDFTENSENSWKFMKYSEKLGTIKHVP